ncbi:hypothetical protein OS493_037741 [Desmophyllum pertusum]|uniref:Uncharacterized protein n=1 Tax=Desmophyllum pertusum TaxID=174260 RepID=A0A9W9YHV2_9CNID|nr:hypothetical protein OS493_037741 [Desmophyllum pertusum]
MAVIGVDVDRSFSTRKIIFLFLNPRFPAGAFAGNRCVVSFYSQWTTLLVVWIMGVAVVDRDDGIAEHPDGLIWRDLAFVLSYKYSPG